LFAKAWLQAFPPGASPGGWQTPVCFRVAIIRRYLPKGIDLSPFTDKNLADLEFVLNNMPRQILGFKTPHEIFSRLKIDHVAGVALQA